MNLKVSTYYILKQLLSLVWIGVAFALATAVLGIICMKNFGKGLKPFIQRGSLKLETESNNMKKAKAHESWVIDED